MVLRASYSSVPATAPSVPAEDGAPFPTTLGPAATAATLPELRNALADPTVLLVTLTAHIVLNGQQLEVAQRAQPGAALALLGGACGAPAPSGRPLPVGTCALDAVGRSRVLLLRPGASLSLLRVVLLRGTSLQGGCVLAVAAQLNATASVFADCAASGDGGGVLSLAGAAVTLSSCARAPPASTPAPPARRVRDASMPRMVLRVSCALRFGCVGRAVQQLWGVVGTVRL